MLRLSYIFTSLSGSIPKIRSVIYAILVFSAFRADANLAKVTLGTIAITVCLFHFCVLVPALPVETTLECATGSEFPGSIFGRTNAGNLILLLDPSPPSNLYLKRPWYYACVSIYLQIFGQSYIKA